MDDRKAQVLSAVVRGYTETGQPVASAALAQALNVSSATVRNDMAALEDEGYLEQPHTSAGRVPTNLGYQYFIDNSVDLTLTPETAARVASFFSKAHGELDQLLQQTTQVLTQLTGCTAVVVEPRHDNAEVLNVQLVPMNAQHGLFVVVLADGTIEKRFIETPELDDRLAASVSLALSTAMVGRTLSNAQALGANPDAATTALAHACLSTLGRRSSDNDRAFVGGAFQVASQFEETRETGQQLLHMLEQQRELVDILRSVVSRGQQVAFDTPVDGTAIVASGFGDRLTHGELGLVGTKRMDYLHALAATQAVSRELSLRITKG